MTHRSREPNLHRNNAAEWVMWFCMLPAFGVAWAIEKLRRKGAR